MLELEDLHAYYGRSHVVQGVTLQVAQGEAVGLVGHNGVGKTTTLRSIMGVGARTRGSIRFHGYRLQNSSVAERVRRGIGLVPDEEAIFPRMTVEENIRIGAMARRKDEAKRCLDRAYGLFPILRERREQQAGTLSGGQQKMLALARGLAMRPDLILVDEPSEGLMPINVSIIARALRDAVDGGAGVLVVDASFDLLTTVCDRIYVMKHGVITGEYQPQEFASPDELVTTYLGEG
jgi:branched-chain amino acid transport system ATP-binding protein